ncbi:MAG: glycosyltransferase family 2 protein, partial [Chthoniobacterales bacterium]
MSHIAVVIPVYRAERTLRELCRRLTESVGAISEDFEIVLVEDCGGDQSWELIEELAAADGRIKGVRFSRNFGQHYALTAGLDVCDADWVVTMDCDLQDRPEEIGRLYEKALEGYDVVSAFKSERKYPLMQDAGSHAFAWIFNQLADIRYNSQLGSFRLISRKAVDYVVSMRERLRLVMGLIDWMGFPTAVVEVQHDARTDGESSYSFRKRLKLATEVIIAYSDKPLRLSVQFGFLIALLALLGGVIVFVRALFFGSEVLG